MLRRAKVRLRHKCTVIQVIQVIQVASGRLPPDSAASASRTSVDRLCGITVRELQSHVIMARRFWKYTNGYVVECHEGEYSHIGYRGVSVCPASAAHVAK